jgi:hypothetical protein
VGLSGVCVNIAPNGQHLGLFADRTRTAAMRATRLYFWFAAIARVPVRFGAALMVDGVADTPPGPPFLLASRAGLSGSVSRPIFELPQELTVTSLKPRLNLLERW